MVVYGDHVPDPFSRFEDSQFSADIMAEIKHTGFTLPTPIQAQAWPIAMTGRDLVAIAKTGSGKTCGFLLPSIMHIKAKGKVTHAHNFRSSPTVLILAPTRELAVQIKSETDKFGHLGRIINACLYGGQPKIVQRRDLQRGVQIIIATPGRLNDFLQTNEINLLQVSFVVLDEADRMLDMGFEPQIREIISRLPQQRQTLFFSATWPKEVKSIATQFVTNRTVHVFIGPVEDKLVANRAITQHVLCIPLFDKINKLREVLTREIPPGARVIVFCSTKRMCDDLARMMPREYGASSIHGDKSQQERDHVLRSFKEGSRSIMIATDVAARGLDIKNVYGVINYDFPSSGCEDYIHRIGRTGRAGATGSAWCFFTDSDARNARELIKVLEEAHQKVPGELQDMAMRSRQIGGNVRYSEIVGEYGGNRGRSRSPTWRR